MCVIKPCFRHHTFASFENTRRFRVSTKNVRYDIVFAHLSHSLRRVAIEMEMGVFALTDIHLSYNQYKRDYSSNHRGNSFRSRDGIIGRKCLRSDRSKPYQTSFTRCISIDAVTVRTLANRHTHACLRSASRWIDRCVLQTLHASTTTTLHALHARSWFWSAVRVNFTMPLRVYESS